MNDVSEIENEAWNIVKKHVESTNCFRDKIQKLFENMPRDLQDTNLPILLKHMEYLESKKLSALNNRLFNFPLSSTFTEHNFTTELFQTHEGQNIDIQYEPRREDLKIEYDKIIYWIQIKRLSDLAKTEKKCEAFKKITDCLDEIEIPRRYDMALSDGFDNYMVHKDDIKKLVLNELKDNNVTEIKYKISAKIKIEPSINKSLEVVFTNKNYHDLSKKLVKKLKNFISLKINIEVSPSFHKNCKKWLFDAIEKLLITNETELSIEAIAEFTFYEYSNDITHLTPMLKWDLEVSNITGIGEQQIKNSIKKAANGFCQNISQKNINIIVVENDFLPQSTFNEAILGTKDVVGFENGTPLEKTRPNGIFHDQDIIEKVAAVILLEPKGYNYVHCEYKKYFYCNPDFVSLVTKLIPLSSQK